MFTTTTNTNSSQSTNSNNYSIAEAETKKRPREAKTGERLEERTDQIRESSLKENASPLKRQKVKPDSLMNRVSTHLFSKYEIAQDLWLNSTTIISEATFEKINYVAHYLKENNLKLMGVKADGNCFCNAYLGSLETLSKKIPILMEISDKTDYLRAMLANEYRASSKEFIDQVEIRADQIQSDEEWINSDEGGLLALIFEIPIRIITVNQEKTRDAAYENQTSCGISDLLFFSERGRAAQEWETLEAEEKTNEYISIIDIGGHFLYAAPQDYQLKIPQKVLEKKEPPALQKKRAQDASDPRTAPLHPLRLLAPINLRNMFWEEEEPVKILRIRLGLIDGISFSFKSKINLPLFLEQQPRRALKDPIKNAINNYKQAIDLGIPVATIHNVETAEVDGYLVIGENSHAVDLNENHQIEQVRTLLAKSFESKIAFDLSLNKLGIQENGIVTLFNFTEKRSGLFNDPYKLGIFVMAFIETWVDQLKKNGLSRNSTQLILEKITKDIDGFNPDWNEAALDRYFSKCRVEK